MERYLQKSIHDEVKNGSNKKVVDISDDEYKLNYNIWYFIYFIFKYLELYSI